MKETSVGRWNKKPFNAATLLVTFYICIMFLYFHGIHGVLKSISKCGCVKINPNQGLEKLKPIGK